MRQGGERVAISKVILNGVTQMDVTDTTAEAGEVASGEYFYTAAGVKTAGTAGSGSDWTLLATQEFTVNTTSTTQFSIGTIDLSSYWSNISAGDFIWISTRDKAGTRNGYFYGADHLFVLMSGESHPSNANPPGYYYKYDNNAYVRNNGTYGIYPYSISNSYVLNLNAKYNSSYTGAIDGTFKVSVYKLTMPS